MRYGWRDQTVMRVIFQVILCIALPVLVDFLLASFYFWIFGANILDTSYMMYSMPYIASLLTIFNVYYLAYYLAKVGPGNSKTSVVRSEEHTSELQSLMRISYAVFCLKKQNNKN